jgi:hypothetical protein
VITTHGQQHRKATRTAPRRFPIPLQLHYKATSKRGPLYGFGQSTMMSSQEIIFAPADRLEPGMAAEVVLAWPSLLDNRIRLQLVLQVVITGSEGGVAEAQILAHHFRPAGPA